MRLFLIGAALMFACPAFGHSGPRGSLPPSGGAAVNLLQDTDGDTLPDTVVAGDYDGDGTLEMEDLQRAMNALTDTGPKTLVTVPGDYLAPANADAGYAGGGAPTNSLLQLASNTTLICDPSTRLLANTDFETSEPYSLVGSTSATGVTVRGCNLDGGAPGISGLVAASGASAAVTLAGFDAEANPRRVRVSDLLVIRPDKMGRCVAGPGNVEKDCWQDRDCDATYGPTPSADGDCYTEAGQVEFCTIGSVSGTTVTCEANTVGDAAAAAWTANPAAGDQVRMVYRGDSSVAGWTTAGRGGIRFVSSQNLRVDGVRVGFVPKDCVAFVGDTQGTAVVGSTLTNCGGYNDAIQSAGFQGNGGVTYDLVTSGTRSENHLLEGNAVGFVRGWGFGTVADATVDRVRFITARNNSLRWVQKMLVLLQGATNFTLDGFSVEDSGGILVHGFVASTGVDRGYQGDNCVKCNKDVAIRNGSFLRLRSQGTSAASAITIGSWNEGVSVENVSIRESIGRTSAGGGIDGIALSMPQRGLKINNVRMADLSGAGIAETTADSFSVTSINTGTDVLTTSANHQLRNAALGDGMRDGPYFISATNTTCTAIGPVAPCAVGAHVFIATAPTANTLTLSYDPLGTQVIDILTGSTMTLQTRGFGWRSGEEGLFKDFEVNGTGTDFGPDQITFVAGMVFKNQHNNLSIESPVISRTPGSAIRFTGPTTGLSVTNLVIDRPPAKYFGKGLEANLAGISCTNISDAGKWVFSENGSNGSDCDFSSVTGTNVVACACRRVCENGSNDGTACITSTTCTGGGTCTDAAWTRNTNPEHAINFNDSAATVDDATITGVVKNSIIGMASLAFGAVTNDTRVDITSSMTNRQYSVTNTGTYPLGAVLYATAGGARNLANAQCLDQYSTGTRNRPHVNISVNGNQCLRYPGQTVSGTESGNFDEFGPEQVFRSVVDPDGTDGCTNGQTWIETDTGDISRCVAGVFVAITQP